MPHKYFIAVVKNSKDLITQTEMTVAGFSQQSREKMRIASTYIKAAYSIEDQLLSERSLEEIIANPKLYKTLLFAIGLSEKAQAHLAGDPGREMVQNTLKMQFRNQDIRKIRKEILFRYLITIGDSIGGSSRNLTGGFAQRQIADLVIDTLAKNDIQPTTVVSDTGKIQIISWDERILLFDKKPKFAGNSIDLILLRRVKTHNQYSVLMEKEENYLALGELKGGIDPAGADEHWKTATKALERIRNSFPKGKCPNLFFAGAAIEAKMAQEIYDEIMSGKLAFAANITSREQTIALIHWLLDL